MSDYYLRPRRKRAPRRVRETLEAAAGVVVAAAGFVVFVVFAAVVLAFATWLVFVVVSAL